MLVLFFSFLFLGLNTAYSQNKKRSDLSKERKKQIQQKVETVRLLKMVETLDLDDEQALKVNGIMKKYDQEQMELHRNRKNELRELRQELTKENPNQKQIKSHTQNIQDIDQKIPEIRKRETQEVGKHLNEVQQGKYLIFKDDFNQNVKQILRERKQGQRRDQMKNPRQNRNLRRQQKIQERQK